MAEYDSGGTLTARYAHGPGPDEPLADWTVRDLPTFFHQDHQNTTVALSGTGGVITGSPYTYDAYGQPAGGTFTGPRFRFTGQTSLPGAPPLWHYKARAYAPGIGRFLQTDPIGYEDSLNLYQYVGNDPFNLTDPTGMHTCGSGPCPPGIGVLVGDIKLAAEASGDPNLAAIAAALGAGEGVEGVNFNLVGSDVGYGAIVDDQGIIQVNLIGTMVSATARALCDLIESPGIPKGRGF